MTHLLLSVTHHSAAAVIVQIHERSGIFHHPLPGIHKGFGKLDTVVDIVTAAAPVEVALLVARPASPVGVAAADFKLALTARSCNGVDDARRGNGVNECCFPAT